MSDEPNKVWVHLYGGEQDGYRKNIELKTTAPKKLYIWHVMDGKKIDDARGKNQMVLRSKLATMAYELFDEVAIEENGRPETEYRYRRCEAADKVITNPAV